MHFWLSSTRCDDDAEEVLLLLKRLPPIQLLALAAFSALISGRRDCVCRSERRFCRGEGKALALLRRDKRKGECGSRSCNNLLRPAAMRARGVTDLGLGGEGAGGPQGDCAKAKRHTNIHFDAGLESGRSLIKYSPEGIANSKSVRTDDVETDVMPPKRRCNTYDPAQLS